MQEENSRKIQEENERFNFAQYIVQDLEIELESDSGSKFNTVTTDVV